MKWFYKKDASNWEEYFCYDIKNHYLCIYLTHDGYDGIKYCNFESSSEAINSSYEALYPEPFDYHYHYNRVSHNFPYNISDVDEYKKHIDDFYSKIRNLLVFI